MPVAGRKPKEGPKRNRMPPVHDWVLVEDRPYKGRPPVTLPTRRIVQTKDGTAEVPLLDITKRWWRSLARMPHASLWSESDWWYALETALTADAAFRGDAKAMAELRQREKVLGTTHDARRDLRIRYVEPEKPAPRSRAKASAAEVATVTKLDDRRSRVIDDAP